jgi:hypothetical protein
MDPDERDRGLIAAGEPAWGKVDAGTTSVTYWLAQLSRTETFLYRMIAQGDNGPIYFESYADGRWTEDAMEALYLRDRDDEQATDVKLTGRQAADVMRNIDAGLSEVWRAPQKSPPHGFAMVLATAAVFGALYLAIGAAILSAHDTHGPYEGVQAAARAIVSLSPFWLLLLVGLAWRLRTALAAFIVGALAMAIVTMILGMDLAESLGPLGLASMRTFSMLTIPYAVAAGAAIVEYRSRPRSDASPGRR